MTWQFGSSLSPSYGIGPVRVDPNSFGISGISGIPNAYWAMLVVPGLILYVDEQTLHRAGVTITTVSVAKYIYDQYKRAQDNPKGGLLPNPQPAPVYSQFELQPVEPLDLDSTCFTPNWLDQLIPWPVPFTIPLPVWP